jgi:hypothetical protein
MESRNHKEERYGMWESIKPFWALKMGVFATE